MFPCKLRDTPPLELPVETVLSRANNVIGPNTKTNETRSNKTLTPVAEDRIVKAFAMLNVTISDHKMHWWIRT